MSFLPINLSEAKERGFETLDFVIITGDAYVDHPSFGTAIISRILEAEGYSVGIVAQPSFKNTDDIARFGKPRLAFMINAGNIDSMVAHYTAAKRKRSDDAYSPGNKAGLRPDRAVTVYTKLVRERFGGEVPIIIGGLEASLRRFAHYDYWADEVMQSVLTESGADILSFGMGERSTRQLAKKLADGIPVSEITDVLGTCYKAKTPEGIVGIMLPSFEKVKDSKEAYASACRIEYDEHDAVRGKRLIQLQANGEYLVQNPPQPSLTTEEMDEVYALHFERTYHPSYEKFGGVPAIKEVEFSITHNRGCFGACNFCSIAFHQGRQISVRSEESVLKEAELLTKKPNFKGYIHDVGGPTANFRAPSCDKQLKAGLCKGKKCLAPNRCPALKVDHTEYLELLRKMRKIPKIKSIFIRSGIRYDYLIADKNEAFFKDLVRYHVSGQLKVAPEHCSAAVLDKMGKPHIEEYLKFSKRFYELTKSMDLEQYLVPYLMSSHPGSTLSDAVELALFLKKQGVHPRQVQDFYPTPGTISTCMFYTGLDPYTMKPVYVAKTKEEKQMQRALLQYFKPENRKIIEKALKITGKTRLKGSSPDCLIPAPAGFNRTENNKNGKGNSRNRQPRKGSNRWDPKKARKR